MGSQLIVVVQDGLVQDVYSETESDVEVLIVDYDARQFGEDDDERVLLLSGERVWISGYSPVVDPEFVSMVREVS
jgi:hypothetical protein